MDRKELKARAKEAVLAAPGTKGITLVFLGAILLLFLLEIGVTELVGRSSQNVNYLSQMVSSQTRSYVAAVGVSLVCQLVMVIFQAGYQGFGLDLSRRESWSMQTLLDGFYVWHRVVLAYLLVSILLGLWSSILSMPLSYLLTSLYLTENISMDTIITVMTVYMLIVMWILSYRYRLMWFVLMDDTEKPVRQVIAETKAINQGHRMELFLLDLSFVPWGLLCLLTCGVLLIWKLPWMIATYALAYQKMVEEFAVRRTQADERLAEYRRQMEQYRNKEDDSE